MRIGFNAWLHSPSCCCCIPVRAGFVLVSVLTFLLSGTISVIIWFEISHSYQLSTHERVAFVLAGVIESLLFLASTIGFIGVVARKQLFVMIYTYFLYVHFVLNIIVGVYFLVTVRASNRQQLVDYCADVFVNTSLESSCARLMGVSTYVFIAIIVALLSLEFYAVLTATRYVYRLRKQKRDDRSRRLGYFHALSWPETSSTRHSRQASDHIELLRSQDSTGGEDLHDLEDAVFDIRTQSYMPMSTYDDSLPLSAPALGPPLSPPRSSLETISGRRVRALPPRPSMESPSVVRATNRPREDTTRPARLPNPHEQPDNSSEDELQAEVSTTAHSAMMDHAAYIQPIFTRPDFSR